MRRNDQSPRMSDEAVKAKTGRVWKEWFAIIDKAGGKKMTHKEIVKLLSTKHDVGPWWCQMVTVTYEQDRGLRQKHEKADGYQVSVSRTVEAPLSDLYKAFADEKRRATWLGEDRLVVRRAAANKSMRVTWHDAKSSLEVNFYSKGEDKSQVIVQHSKLPNAKSAAKMKKYWSESLDRLRDSFA